MYLVGWRHRLIGLVECGYDMILVWFDWFDTTCSFGLVGSTHTLICFDWLKALVYLVLLAFFNACLMFQFPESALPLHTWV